MPATASASAKSSVNMARLGQVLFMGLLTLLILCGGVWGSWGNAQHVMLSKGRESGTIQVTRCADKTCTGPFTPVSEGARARASVRIAKTVAVRKGETYAVVVKPGTDEVVRSGPAGVLYAWVPLGGALLLAAVVVAGGLRLSRPAWILGAAGGLLLTAAFAALQAS